MNRKFFSIAFMFVFMGSITAMELELKEVGASKAEKVKDIKGENDEKVQKIGIFFDSTFPQDGKAMSYYVTAALYGYPEIVIQRSYFPTRVLFKNPILKELRERWQEKSSDVQIFGEQLYKFYDEIGAQVAKIKMWPDTDWAQYCYLRSATDGELLSVIQHIVLKSAIDKKLLLERVRAIPGNHVLILDQSDVSELEKHIDERNDIKPLIKLMRDSHDDACGIQ